MLLILISRRWWTHQLGYTFTSAYFICLYSLGRGHLQLTRPPRVTKVRNHRPNDLEFTGWRRKGSWFWDLQAFNFFLPFFPLVKYTQQHKPHHFTL